MGKVVTLGEIMLRLSPPGYERFIQANSFDVTYGGTEANISVSLSRYGHNSVFVTKLPQNAIADCAVASLMKSGVDCSCIVRGGERMGIYFLEHGASVRAPSVVYDRSGSSMAEVSAEEFDFEQILEGASLFHISGITPVLSKEAAKLTRSALKTAKNKGITTSFDLNYREKLWINGAEEKQKMMRTLMPYVDICFGNARDVANVLGYQEDGVDYINGDYAICVTEDVMRKVMRYYGFTTLVTSLRESISASDNTYSAFAVNETEAYRGTRYTLHIVDRVGTGDSFASGYLHGILSGKTMQDSLEFAIAASAIKHTIPGDINYTTISEIESLAAGNAAGRVQR